MYTNSAYIGEMHEDIVDTSKPILVTAAGYFRLEKTPVFETVRPEPRGDYQLLYISSGKLHLYEDGEERIITKGNMILFVRVSLSFIIFILRTSLKPIGFILLVRTLIPFWTTMKCRRMKRSSLREPRPTINGYINR